MGRNDHAASCMHRRLKRSDVSLLKNAKNPYIRDSSFVIGGTTNVNLYDDTVSDPVLDRLYSEVAPNAILNAGGRTDQVKCYPGTREEVISVIEHWMEWSGDDQNADAPSIMWLSGPVGAGKSAIVQTIAERCKESRVQVASFFFFRADPTRSSARPLVATLLYQILKFYPSARRAIATVLANDPLVFDASIQEQFTQLLLSPLRNIPQTPELTTRRPIVLLIDGLEQCDSEDPEKTSQRQILSALNYLLLQDNCPFLVLVASRAEPHITMTVRECTSPVQSVFLDSRYKPEEDVRLFVTGEFRRIKEKHPLAHTLKDDWPSAGDAEAIVKKSSGQFIFAATVMRSLANSSASPKLSLERVQGIVPIAVATSSPFVHLDAVYRYILSQPDDRQAVMDLLSAKLFYNSLGFTLDQIGLTTLLCAYNPRYTFDLIVSCISDLSAILHVSLQDPEQEELVFFHDSLPDFLGDQSRAREFHIDIDSFSAKILPAIWIKLAQTSFMCEWPQRGVVAMSDMSLADLMLGASLAIQVFVSLKTPTPDIMNAFLTISPASTHLEQGSLESVDAIFRSIHRLYYPHDMESYRKITCHWVSWYIHGPTNGNTHDMNECLSLPYVAIYFWVAKIQLWSRTSISGTLSFVRSKYQALIIFSSVVLLLVYYIGL